MSREELVEAAVDAISAEMNALPDDECRAAAFLAIAARVNEWGEDIAHKLATSPLAGGAEKESNG